jgi:diaminohydroxyphosphoribosylaminopyrimidine deaminase/5-amino-6-(5-phosphoribosylamino)uracil reductase
MVTSSDNFFMQKALDEAWKYQGITYPNPPVGAVIVNDSGSLISIGVHKEIGANHAELEAVKNGLIHYTQDDSLSNISDPTELYLYIIDHYKDFFKNHTMYVTLEPCTHYGKTPPCSKLLKILGFSRIVIATSDINKDVTGGYELLSKSTQVDIGVLEDKAQDILMIFKKYIENKSFIFFKVAVTMNGAYTGGTISSLESRRLTHKLREKCDLLVIGGESVRVDRPTLDTRLTSGKDAPDILIYSKSKDFDQDIPLFNVTGRSVYISDSLEILSRYKFIMIEGGANMFQIVRDMCDMFMIFRTNKITNLEGFCFEKSLQRLNRFKYYNDTIEWYKG